MASEETAPACAVIRGGQAFAGKQGMTYFTGVSAETVGSRQLCMHLLTIPPAGRAHAHLHEGHESVVYVLSGEGEMWYGEGLCQHLLASAGDFVFIPAGVPHAPGNRSQTEPLTAVVARSDPHEQESVVLLPELSPPS